MNPTPQQQRHDQQHPPPTRADRRAGWVLRFLPALTLAAVVTVTSTSEWTLARTVLDLPPAVAWAVPVAIDSYVIAALRTRRDVLPAVLVMAGALGSAMGAHLVAAEQGGGTLPVRVTAPAAALILSVLVIVAWRVHVLIDHLTDSNPAPAAGPAPVAVPVPVLATRVRPVPGASATAAVPVRAVAPGTAVAGGRGAAAPRRPVPASASTAIGTGVPAESAAARHGWSDEQILADLTAAGEATSPGIRALKRTYAIGQTRAARIHQQITDQPTQESKKNSMPNQQNSTTSSQNNDQQETEPATSQSHEETDQKNQIQECTGIDQEQTHKGITDRVGQSRSTAEYGAEAFPAFSQAGGQA